MLPFHFESECFPSGSINEIFKKIEKLNRSKIRREEVVLQISIAFFFAYSCACVFVFHGHSESFISAQFRSKMKMNISTAMLETDQDLIFKWTNSARKIFTQRRTHSSLSHIFYRNCFFYRELIIQNTQFCFFEVNKTKWNWNTSKRSAVRQITWTATINPEKSILNKQKFK